jgi:hypothetical protein
MHQLGQALSKKIIQYDLIPKFDLLGPQEVETALAKMRKMKVTELRSGTPLYYACLVALEARKDEAPKSEPARKSKKELEAEVKQAVNDYLGLLASGEDEAAAAIYEQLIEIAEKLNWQSNRLLLLVGLSIADWVETRPRDDLLAVYEAADRLSNEERGNQVSSYVSSQLKPQFGPAEPKSVRPKLPLGLTSLPKLNLPKMTSPREAFASLRIVSPRTAKKSLPSSTPKFEPLPLEPEPGTVSVTKAVKTYEAKVDASKTLPELKAEGAQLLKAYVTALVEGDEQARTALMERLAEIIDQIIDMETGKHRRDVIPAVIDSWIKGLGLAERKIEERLAIYQHASHLRPDSGYAREVRDSLLKRLQPEVNDALAQAFISAARDGDKAEISQAAVKLQEHCLRRDADPTREDLRERLKDILEGCLKQHPLSADDEKRLRANLPHRSESEAVKILRDLVKGESKVPALKLPKLPNVARLLDSPDSPFKSPRKKALAASAPAPQPPSLAASAPPAPRPDPKGVAAMENFIFQLIAGDSKGIETSFYELRTVILSLEVEMNALDPLIDAALKDTPTEGLETIAPLIEKGFGVQDVVFKEVQHRLSGRIWAELIVRRLLEHPDVNESADLEAAHNGLNDYLDHDERDLERDVKVQLLFSRALRDRSKKELEILANVHLEKKSQIDKGLMNALLLAKEEESEELIRKKKT